MAHTAGQLAATDIHISLKAEKLLEIGPLTITNSMVYGLLTTIFAVAVLVWAARKIRVKPAKGFAQIIEIIVEFLIGLLEGPLGNRQRAVKYAPIFGTFFLFIIFNNILGLLPLVGPGLTLNVDGVHTPLFRPYTADINGTIAMSIIAIVLVQVLSIRTQGGKMHLQHYFTNKPWNPINFFIGLLEVFGEFTRILSLSLRLFLNTAVGEILIAVFTSLVVANGRTPLSAIPIYMFEMLVAGIQAYVFTILSATYLGLAISHADEHHHHEELDQRAPVQAKAVGAVRGG